MPDQASCRGPTAGIRVWRGSRQRFGLWRHVGADQRGSGGPFVPVPLPRLQGLTRGPDGRPGPRVHTLQSTAPRACADVLILEHLRVTMLEVVPAVLQKRFIRSCWFPRAPPSRATRRHRRTVAGGTERSGVHGGVLLVRYQILEQFCSARPAACGLWASDKPFSLLSDEWFATPAHRILCSMPFSRRKALKKKSTQSQREEKHAR